MAKERRVFINYPESLKTDQNNLNFSLKGDNRHGSDGAQNDQNTSEATLNAGDDEGDTEQDEALALAGATQAASDNLVDIRV